MLRSLLAPVRRSNVLKAAQSNARRNFASSTNSFLTAQSVLSQYPATQVTTLSNGIRVATEPGHGETATIGVWTDTGSRYEDAKTNGVAHFLEHMCFKGTAKRTQLQLEQEVENMGGHLNAYTSRESTIFYAKVFKNDVKQGLDILADILQNSKLDQAAVEREKDTILRESDEVDGQMEEVIFDRLHETAFRGTPLGRTILGTADNIRNMTRDSLVNYRSKMFTGDRMVICGAGAVDHGSLVRMAQDMFGAVPKSSQVVHMEPAKFTGSDIRVRYDSMPLAHVALAFPTAGWNDPDNFSLMVLQMLLGSFNKAQGGNAKFHSSPLVRNLLKEDAATSIMPFNTQYSDIGLFGVYGVGDQYSLAEMTTQILDALVASCHHVEPVALEEAKKQLTMSLLSALDGSTAVCEDIGRQMLSHGRRLHPLETLQRIEAVTPESVKAVADRYFNDRDLALAAVGPTWELPDYVQLRRKTYWVRF